MTPEEEDQIRLSDKAWTETHRKNATLAVLDRHALLLLVDELRLELRVARGQLTEEQTRCQYGRWLNQQYNQEHVAFAKRVAERVCQDVLNPAVKDLDIDKIIEELLAE